MMFTRLFQPSAVLLVNWKTLNALFVGYECLKTQNVRSKTLFYSHHVVEFKQQEDFKYYSPHFEALFDEILNCVAVH